MSVYVRKISGLATIQDIGRFGARQYGYPTAGFLDRSTGVLAQSAFSSRLDHPVIELVNGGMVLETEVDINCVVLGSAALKKDGATISGSDVINLEQGSVLEISKADSGNISYISFNKKMTVDYHLGSCSTYLPMGIGGHQGRNLRKGDLIVFEAGKVFDFRLKKIEARSYPSSVTVRMVQGPEYSLLKSRSNSVLDSESFELSSTMDRTGYRFVGTILAHEDVNLTSRIVQRGTVQLPGNGQPIVLMSDAQVTGGYPRIGQIIAEDIDRIAQLQPGNRIRFRLVDDFT